MKAGDIDRWYGSPPTVGIVSAIAYGLATLLLIPANILSIARWLLGGSLHVSIVELILISLLALHVGLFLVVMGSRRWPLYRILDEGLCIQGVFRRRVIRWADITEICGEPRLGFTVQYRGTSGAGKQFNISSDVDDIAVLIDSVSERARLVLAVEVSRGAAGIWKCWTERQRRL